MSYLCDRNREDTQALIRSPLTAPRSPLITHRSPLIRSSAHPLTTHGFFLLSAFSFLPLPTHHTMSSVVNRQFVFSTDVLLL